MFSAFGRAGGVEHVNVAFGIEGAIVRGGIGEVICSGRSWGED